MELFTTSPPARGDAVESHGRRSTVGSNTHASTCPHPPQVPVRRLDPPCQDACGFFILFSLVKRVRTLQWGREGQGVGRVGRFGCCPTGKFTRPGRGLWGAGEGMRERLLGGESGSRQSGLTCSWDMCQCVCVCWAAREALVADQGGGPVLRTLGFAVKEERVYPHDEN